MGVMGRPSGGFSLIELIAILSLLGLLASVVIPAAAPYHRQKLDLAASELSTALRFARDEAIRTGQYRAIKINKTSGLVSIGKPEILAGEITGFEFLAINPVDKRTYDFSLHALPQATGVRIDPTTTLFNFRSLVGDRDTCLFDPDGNPLFLTGNQNYSLSSAAVVLQNRSETATVALSLLGRVTVQ